MTRSEKNALRDIRNVLLYVSPFIFFLFIAGCGGGSGATAPVNTAPTARLSASSNSVQAGQQVTFDASGSTDSETSSANLQVRWDYDNDGVFDTSSSTVKTAGTNFNTAGVKVIRVAISDEGGLSSEATTTISVSLCSSNASCNDNNALTLDVCANPGLVTATCSNTAYACNVDNDCNDSNSNTIDTCTAGGTLAAVCTNVVSRAIQIDGTAINPNAGNAAVNNANVVVKDGSGATVFSGSTNTSGQALTGNLGAGTYTVTFTEAAGSVPHFVNPTAISLTVSATGAATATFNVTPEYNRCVNVVKQSDNQAVLGANVSITTATNTYAQTVDATGKACFTDVPLGDYTATVANRHNTTPVWVASDTPSLDFPVYGDTSTLTYAVLRTECYASDPDNDGCDTSCMVGPEGENLLDTGMTCGSCFVNEDTSAAACRQR